ncbi:MAG: hypothetical protein ACLQBY_08950 [Solirubrobacteraceae bacterium]
MTPHGLATGAEMYGKRSATIAERSRSSRAICPRRETLAARSSGCGRSSQAALPSGEPTRS